METPTMGRVLTEVMIANLGDLFAASRGLLPPEQTRRITAPDALVDTGASTLGLPKRLLDQLGLKKTSERQVRSIAGQRTISLYEAVRLTILGRDMPVDPMEIPDDLPVLIGQLPLEALDLVIDMANHRLVVNPAHGGEQILDLL
jgi:predicted aspartyl protease